MDYGTNTNSLSLTGGDNIDDINDTLINLATNISSNLSLIDDVSGSLNTLNIQVQDLSGVVDENIIDICNNTILIGDVSYNLNTLTNEVQDLSGVVQDLSGVVQDLSGVVQDLSGVVDTKVSKSGDTMTGDLIVDNAKIGSAGSSNAFFANKDRFTGGQYALIQNTSGTTFLNTYNATSSSATIYFRTNGDDRMYLTQDGLTIKDNKEITYKGQTLDDRFHPSGDYALQSVFVDLSTNFYVLQNTTIQDLSSNHYALENVVVDLSSNHYALENVVVDLSSNHYALENVVIDLSGNVATNVSNIEDISGLVQVNIASISSHNTRITSVEDTLQDLQDELEEIDDDGQGGSVFDAIFGAGTAVSLATIASLAYQAYTIAVSASASATTANATNAIQDGEIDTLQLTRQFKLVNSALPNLLVETNEAGIYNITSSGLIDANEITATDISATDINATNTISANGFISTTGYGTGNTQITPSYTDIYSATTTISGETINITGNTAVNVNGNINLNGNNISGVNVLTFSGSSIEGLDTLNFKTASGSNASISNLKSVSGENFTIQADGDAIFGSKTISTLQTATQVGTLITTAINTLIGNAGSGYDTLVELQNEIENNDLSLNEVFTNVATKVSKSGDTMTGKLTMDNCNIDLSGACLIEMDGTQAINAYSNYIRLNEGTGFTGVIINGDLISNGDLLSKGQLRLEKDTTSITTSLTGKRIKVINNSYNKHSNPPVATSYWFKVATLPASTLGTWDFCELTLVGGKYELEKIKINAMFKNRSASSSSSSGFEYNYMISGNETEKEKLRIRCYNNSGAIDIYIYLDTTQFITFHYDIDSIQCTIYDNPTAQTSVTGTLVFDSGDATNYPPNRTLTLGGIENSSDLTLTAGDDVIINATDDIFLYADDAIEIDGDVKINQNVSGNSFNVNCDTTMSGDLTLNGDLIVNSSNQIITDELNDTNDTADELNYISIEGSTNKQKWLRFRRGGAPPLGECGVIFGSYDNNNFFMRNTGSLLKINFSNIDIDDNRTGVGNSASGSEVFSIDNTGDTTIQGDLEVGGDTIINGKFTQSVAGADYDNQNYIIPNSGVRKSRMPHHIDTYYHGTAGDGGRKLYLNYYSNSDVEIGGDEGGNLICSNNLEVGGDIKISNFPLITQIYGFYQRNSVFTGNDWLAHAPIRDNATDACVGMVAPVDILPYAISVATENDGSTDTGSVSFIVKSVSKDDLAGWNLYRKRVDLNNINSFYMEDNGNCSITMGANITDYAVLSSQSVIPAGTSFGIYFTENISNFNSEVSIKLYCTQV